MAILGPWLSLNVMLEAMSNENEPLVPGLDLRPRKPLMLPDHVTAATWVPVGCLLPDFLPVAELVLISGPLRTGTYFLEALDGGNRYL